MSFFTYCNPALTLPYKGYTMSIAVNFVETGEIHVDRLMITTRSILPLLTGLWISYCCLISSCGSSAGSNLSISSDLSSWFTSPASLSPPAQLVICPKVHEIIEIHRSDPIEESEDDNDNYFCYEVFIPFIIPVSQTRSFSSSVLAYSELRNISLPMRC